MKKVCLEGKKRWRCRNFTFENYETVVTNGECIIRPLARWITGYVMFEMLVTLNKSIVKIFIENRNVKTYIISIMVNNI